MAPSDDDRVGLTFYVPESERREARVIHGGGHHHARTHLQVTFDRYGHLMPGNEAEAMSLMDAYLERMSRTGDAKLASGASP